MITRADIVSIAAEHGQRELGEEIADRLGLPASPLDALGVGVFVRNTKDVPIALAQRFDHVCVTLIDKERRPRNRAEEWMREVREGDTRILALDLLPEPGTWRTGLHAAIEAAASYGAIAFVVDPERAWKGHAGAAEEYAHAVREACARFQIAYGFTSYATPKAHPTFPWKAFLAECELAIPQCYDRDGAFDADYATRAIEQYRALGAKRVLLGRGAFQRTHATLKPRWRTPIEIHQHATTTPHAGLAGAVWWPLAGHLPDTVVEAIRAT